MFIKRVPCEIHNKPITRRTKTATLVHYDKFRVIKQFIAEGLVPLTKPNMNC